MKTTMRKAAAVTACGIALFGTTALSGPASADRTRTVGERGARAPAAQQLFWVYVWATNVNVRDNTSGPNCNAYPSVDNCPGIVRKVSRQEIGVYCQKRGQPVSDSGYHSEWWSYTYNGPHHASGWTSNVYIRGKAHLDGVPDCTF
ncbi:MAG TPA: hypothetical protein VH912_22775 [Streptosporangiaceae bacterium]|jgi:hypothetical protein